MNTFILTTSNPSALKDRPETIDLNFGAAVEQVDGWLDGFVRLIPNIGVALIVLILFIAMAKGLRKLTIWQATRSHRDSLGQMLGSFVHLTLIFFGLLAAATIVFPTLHPGEVVTGLGVTSVAIGFAFKDILQNWLAGLLILLRQPFSIGDEIVLGSFEGAVQRIESRATIIRTYNGESIVIPNSEIYTNALRVKTAEPSRRSGFDVGIGYSDDSRRAVTILSEAVAQVDGVLPEPAPVVFHWALEASWVTLRVQWWTGSAQSEVAKTRSNVVECIKYTLDEAGMDMPFETQVHLQHDQTEDSDKSRESQREGWPADKSASK